MLPPSGQTSSSGRCWKMQSWGPGIQSFEVANMNFGYFGQHTRCKKKPYWLFLLPPSGQASCSRRCWKRHSKGTGIKRFEAVNVNIGYPGSVPALWKNIMGTFWYHLQSKVQAQEGVGKCSPEAQLWWFLRSRAKPGNPAFITLKSAPRLILARTQIKFQYVWTAKTIFFKSLLAYIFNDSS